MLLLLLEPVIRLLRRSRTNHPICRVFVLYVFVFVFVFVFFARAGHTSSKFSGGAEPISQSAECLCLCCMYLCLFLYLLLKPVIRLLLGSRANQPIGRMFVFVLCVFVCVVCICICICICCSSRLYVFSWGAEPITQYAECLCLCCMYFCLCLYLLLEPVIRLLLGSRANHPICRVLHI